MYDSLRAYWLWAVPSYLTSLYLAFLTHAACAHALDRALDSGNTDWYLRGCLLVPELRTMIVDIAPMYPSQYLLQ